ncbi:MAG TPA: phosphatase PAP2 family protein, partial [Myxococcales bacterium]|nr:phosphatase PAP2 family protein [Myxococcales bacterium]
AQYGLGPARLDIIPAAAAAVRFDALLGTHLFAQMYGRGVDVYGAYPSLHVAYPLIVFVMTLREKSVRWARVPAFAFFLLMCLSAVYLQHHYLTDAFLGVAYAGATLWLAAQWSALRASPAQSAASGSLAISARRSASA